MADQNAPPPSSQVAPQPRVALLAESLLIVLVFFAMAGEPAPHHNEPHYLCRLKQYWNPNWCVGDLFLDSPDAHATFVWTFGWITRWLSLPATAWVGRLLAWTLIAWAWQRLSWRLVPVRLAAVLAAALWITLTERAHLAGEWVVGGVEAKCFAYLFVLLALRELVDGRWNRAWLFLGAASAFHVLVGGWSVVVVGGIWLFRKGDKSNFGQHRPARRSLSREIGLIPFSGILALLGVVPALALTWGESPELVAEANRIYVFERLPHHLALLTLPSAEIVERLARHAALLVALWGLTRVQTRQLGDGWRRVIWFAWGAALLAGIALAIELAFRNDPLRAAAILRYYWSRLTDVAVPLAVSLLAVRVIAAGVAQRQNWAAWALAAALALTGWHLVAVSWSRVEHPVPPSDRRMRDYAAWVDVCTWVALHTPPDALFLTPRRAQSFKWRTGRPEVATWKDIPQDARSMVEWFRRLRAIYYEEVDGEIQPVKSLGHLGTERVAALAKEYGVDYVVTDGRRPLGFHVAYWNQEYVVYVVDR